MTGGGWWQAGGAWGTCGKGLLCDRIGAGSAKLRSSCCSAVEVVVRPGDHIMYCWMVNVGGYLVSCITI